MQIGHFIVGALVLVMIVLAIRLLARLGHPLTLRRSRSLHSPSISTGPVIPVRERSGEYNYDPLSMYDK